MSNQARWDRFNPLPADIEQRLAGLPQLFAKTDVQLAYLFGSLGQGKPGNDVDLALLTATTPVYQLQESIAAHLNTQRLDLVDLKLASPTLRFEIIRTGQIIYTVNEATENDFELRTIQLYRDTAPSRRRQTEYLKARMARWS